MKGASPNTWVLIGAASLIFPLLGYWAHVSLINYCYLRHARRFCRRNNLGILRWRAGDCFAESHGRRVKTELTAFAMDCRTVHGERRVVTMLVGVFGIKVAYGFPGFPAEPGTAPIGGPQLSVLWERGSGPPSVS
jgi:hypothetical protein